MRLLAQRIAGRIPIIVGASDPDPAEARRHIALAAEIGAGAAMVIAPFALGNDVAAQTAYFTRGGTRRRRADHAAERAAADRRRADARGQRAAIANAVPAMRISRRRRYPAGSI